MIDKSIILSRTNGGLDVFKHYFGTECLKKLFRNPYRNDSKPSCHLYLDKGRDGMSRFILQDFGDRTWCGDCFTIAAKVNNLDRSHFSEVLKVIDRDLVLQIDSSNNNFPKFTAPLSAVAVNWQKKEEERSVISFKADYKSFSYQEFSYWSQYGIYMETLTKFHVSSVVDITFKREDGSSFSIFSTKLTPVYAYEFNKGRGVKIYRPKSNVRFMYAGELPRPYVFGWDQLPKQGDSVFITGGEKDVMSLSSHGFNAISFNSETANFSEPILESLKARFKKIILLYDMDETGVNESERMLEKYRDLYPVYRMALPLEGTKAEKDISDWFRLGHKPEELCSYQLEF